VGTGGTQRWAPDSFLARLTAVERVELVALGVTRRLASGRRMLVEGAMTTHVEVIQEGCVKVTVDVGGVPRLLAVRLAGDLVGELAAVTGRDRSATVTTCGEVVSTVIQQGSFLRYVWAHPRVARQMTATVGERLRWANARRSEFAAFPVHVRVARVLCDIADRCARPGGGNRCVAVELNQTEIATLVGAAEDTVQRALRMLRRRGLITTGYRRVTVVDPPALRAVVETATRP
jgi:CRP/FNR family cyclic AMP-dependent transcriptional regulator